MSDIDKVGDSADNGGVFDVNTVDGVVDTTTEGAQYAANEADTPDNGVYVAATEGTPNYTDSGNVYERDARLSYLDQEAIGNGIDPFPPGDAWPPGWTAPIGTPGGGGGDPTCVADPYFSCGPTNDPYWDYVVLMLHMDGADGSTTFVDSSNYARVPSVVLNAELTTAFSKFGGASARKTGNSALIEYAYSEDFSYAGSNAFTVEFWLYVEEAGPNEIYFMGNRTGSGATAKYFRLTTAETLFFRSGSASLDLGTVEKEKWIHVAVSSDRTTIRGFVDGILKSSANAGSFPDSLTDAFSILSAGTLWTNNGLVGCIDEIRFTRGVARYIHNFNVPSAPFPDALEALAPGDDFYLPQQKEELVFEADASTYGRFATGYVHGTSDGTARLHWGQWTSGSSSEKTVKVYSINLNSGAQAEVSSYEIVDTYPATIAFLNMDISGLGTTSSTNIRIYYDDIGSYKTFTFPVAIGGTAVLLKNGDDVFIGSDYLGDPFRVYKYSWTTGGAHVLQSEILDQQVGSMHMIDDVLYVPCTGVSASRKMYAFDRNTLEIIRSENFNNNNAVSVSSNSAVVDGQLLVGNTGRDVMLFKDWNWIPAGYLEQTTGYTNHSASSFVYDGFLWVGYYFSPNRWRVIKSKPCLSHFRRTVMSLHAEPSAETDDPYAANVVLLLNGDSGIADASPNSSAVSATGSNDRTALAGVRGEGSLQCNNGGFFTAVVGAAGIMDGDFTWETWSTTGENNVLFYDATSGAYVYNNNFTGYGGPNLPIETNFSTVDGWRHLAISRVGDTIRSFVNGELFGSVTYSGQVGLSNLRIGYFLPNNNLHWTGRLDNFRITAGVGRYTENFVPDGPKMVDSSCYQPKSIRFGQLSKHTSVEKKFGGSSFFVHNDGTTVQSGAITEMHQDLLLGYSDFTLEVWAYREKGNYNSVLFDMGTSTTFTLEVANATNLVTLTYKSVSGQQVVPTSAVFTPGEWKHVVVQRRGPAFEFFLDGVLIATTAPAYGGGDTVLITQGMFIGRQLSSTNRSWDGYIDELRLTRGVARYANPNLPTAAFPDSAPEDPYWNDVVLLLHMDGADGSTTFTDSSSLALTGTAVGNAKLTTANKYFGAASATFDGNGDWVTFSNGALALGAGDATVELFVRIANATGVQKGILGTLVSPYWFIQKNANESIGFTTNGLGALSTPPLTIGAWYHFAAVRSSGVWRYYLNGVEQTLNAPIADSTDYTDPPTLYVGNFGTTAGNSFDGQIDELRITKGVARYPSAFDLATLQNCNSADPSDPYTPPVPPPEPDPPEASSVIPLSTTLTSSASGLVWQDKITLYLDGKISRAGGFGGGTTWESWFLPNGTVLTDYFEYRVITGSIFSGEVGPTAWAPLNTGFTLTAPTPGTGFQSVTIAEWEIRAISDPGTVYGFSVEGIAYN